MSRCSLQLYVNENFTFSRPSLASSDDFLKNLSTSDWRRSSFATSHTDKEVLQKLNRLKTKNCLAKTLNDNYEEYHPILTSYLLRHTKSVEAYRRIRKQQEEILSLCRKKLAKKLSGSFLSGIRDEDIIRALRLIQDTELQLNEPRHSDTLIHSVLKGIISNDGKWSSKSDQNDNQTSTEVPLLRHLPQNLAYSSSALPKRRKRYNLVFKKLKGFFKKPRSIASTFTLTSKFTDQISTGNTFFRCPTKLFGSIEKELIYPYHIETSPQDYKIYASSAYEKAPRQLHIGMGSKSTCACHRNLLKLQNEFVKQQSEIRLINQNLEQCLCILHDIGDKPQTTHPSPYDSPAKNDFYVYSACPHSGPYGDRYYERSLDPHNYQILPCRKASPKESRSSAKKEPKKKGGCRKSPKKKYHRRKQKKRYICPAECSYTKTILHTDSHYVIFAKKEMAPSEGFVPRKMPTYPKKKRRKFCGCCKGARSTTPSVASTSSRGSKCSRVSNKSSGKPRRPRNTQLRTAQTRMKIGRRCCAKKRRFAKAKPVCHEACIHWSDVSLAARQNTTASQTIPTEEFPHHQLLTFPDQISETHTSTVSLVAKNESTPGLITIPPKLIRCTRRMCSPKKAKSIQCQCKDCKRARKSLVPDVLSTPSTATVTTTPSTPTSSDRSTKKCRRRRGKKSRARKSRAHKSRSKAGESRTRVRKSRSRVGKSRSRLGKSRSRLGKSRSRLGKSRSRFGKSRSKLNIIPLDDLEHPETKSGSPEEKSELKPRKSRSRIGKSISKIWASRSRTGRSRSRVGRSRSRIATTLQKSRSRIGERLQKSRSRISTRLQKSRSRISTKLQKSRSRISIKLPKSRLWARLKKSKSRTSAKAPKSRSRLMLSLKKNISVIGRRSQHRISTRSESTLGGETTTSERVSGASDPSEGSRLTGESEMTAQIGASSRQQKVCTDRKKRKRPCCLVRFCKLYICRG